MASGLMTYSQFKSSRQNSMNGSSARERGDNPAEEGEFEQVGKGNGINGCLNPLVPIMLGALSL